MIEIPPGLATLGQKHGKFGWDNEFDEHQVEVPGFRIGKYKVTNGQYLDFVRDGGSPAAFLDRAQISTRYALVLSRDVFRSPAHSQRARIRDARRSQRLRSMGRKAVAHRTCSFIERRMEHL